MEIQVSSTTSFRVAHCCSKCELMTNKDVPDLDCYYVGTHLSRESLIKKGKNVCYQKVNIIFDKNIDILFNKDYINNLDLSSRAKKFKI